MNDLTENRRRDSMRFAFFIGCTVAYKLPHIEAASRYVMDALDIDPVDLALFLLPGSKWCPLLQLRVVGYAGCPQPGACR